MAIQAFRREFTWFLLPVCIFMLFSLLVPIGFIIYYSFTPSDAGDSSFSLASYQNLLTSRLFMASAQTTIIVAFSATILTVLLGYPVALHLSRISPQWRPLFTGLVLLPFWTSVLVKSYSFIVVLGDAGLVNQLLTAIGLPQTQLLFNRIGLFVGMTNFLIPFAVFPLLSNLVRQPATLRRTADVMGASRTRIFWEITFPLSLPALMVSAVTCFVLSLGVFAIPALLGGRRDLMVANLIDFYTREALDWSTSCAIAVLLLVTCAALFFALRYVSGNRRLV